MSPSPVTCTQRCWPRAASPIRTSTPRSWIAPQELDCAWVEQRTWWYSTTFVGPTALAADERLLLAFEGLDTFATVWLNGQELGRTANMFREHVFDVSTAVRPGAENSLVLCFQPPLEAVAGKPVPGSP